MSLTVDEKSKIIAEFKLNDNDTGSSEVQIALLTVKITRLTEHFETHPKDVLSKRGFLRMIQNRRRALQFLKREDVSRYKVLIAKLNLRK